MQVSKKELAIDCQQKYDLKITCLGILYFIRALDINHHIFNI